VGRERRNPGYILIFNRNSSNCGVMTANSISQKQRFGAGRA
jgi:hypothetical protein